MSRLFRLPSATAHHPAVEVWFLDHADPLGALALQWFQTMRDCGDDVRELMHDGQPTACVGDAAFAYVAVYRAHVNVGFFNGAELVDPAGLLEGSGKFMRHVKVRPGGAVNVTALRKLIMDSYADMKKHVAST